MGVNTERLRTLMNDDRGRSNSSSSATEKGVNTSRLKGMFEKNKVGFDTFNEDFRNTTNTLNSVLTSWQTPEEMKQKKNEIVSMNDRLISYNNYMVSMGNDTSNLKEIMGAYQQTVDNWDDIAKNKAMYKTADAYDTAMFKAKMDEKNSGLTYEQVLSNMNKYKEGTKEYEYFKNYTGYGDLREFEKAMETNKSRELKKAYNAYKLDNKFDTYRDYMDRADFKEKSQYVEGGNDDYEYINDVNGGRNRVTAKQISANSLSPVQLNNNYDRLTEDEKAVYNYIYNTEGEKKAKKYLNDLQVTLSKRNYDEKTKEWEKYSDKGFWEGVLLNAATIPANMIGGISGTAGMISDAIQGKEYNPYSNTMMASNFATDTRKYVGQNISDSEFIGMNKMNVLGVNIPSFLYQTGMSVADSTLGAVTMGKAFAPVMGTNAFAQRFKELKEQGEDDTKSVLGALASGISETLFEYVSIDKLLKEKNIDSASRLVKEALKQGGVEATEEMCTEIANILSDTVIRFESSDISSDLNDLFARGYSKTDAYKKLFWSRFGQVMEAGIGGFLSGVPSGTLFGSMQYKGNIERGENLKANNNVQNVLDMAKSNEDSEASKYLSELEKKGVKSDRMSDAELGALALYTMQDNQSIIDSKKTSQEKKFVAHMQNIAIDGMAMSEKEKNVVKEENKKKFYKDIQYYSDGMNQKEAEFFASQYDGYSNAEDFYNSYSLIYDYGKFGYGVDNALKMKGVLSETQVRDIYSFSIKENSKSAKKFKGGYFNDSIINRTDKNIDGKINYKDLTQTQKGAIEVLRVLSNKLEVDVELYASGVDEKGNRIGKNGSYENGKIVIDIYAGMNNVSATKDLVLNKASHEVTHWLKDAAPVAYGKLQEFVLNKLGSANKSIEVQIAQEIERMKKTHPEEYKKLSFDKARELAIDELVARGCENCLADSNELKNMISSMNEKEKKTFMEKVKSVITSIMDYVEGLIEKYKGQSDTAEAKFLMEVQNELNRLFDEGIREAKETSKRSDETSEIELRWSDRTSDSFELDSTIEQTEKLIAVHNLSEQKLMKMIEMGGFPMPSIAVTKASLGHKGFGPISILFGKDTIDPDAFKDNKVYSRDAWTPTYPTIDYKANQLVIDKVSEKYQDLVNRFGYDDISALYRYTGDNLQDSLNRYGGEQQMLNRLYEDTDLMQIYLLDSEKGKVEPVEVETITEIGKEEKRQHKAFIDAIGKEIIDEFKTPEGFSFTQNREYKRRYVEKYEDKIKNAFIEMFKKCMDLSAEEAYEAVQSMSRKDILKELRAAYNFAKNNGISVQKTIDIDATNKAIREKASDGYKKWVNSLFKGVQEKSGIRNNKDIYTSSGKRRGWDTLHYEETLENVVKAMKEQGEKGIGALGGTIFGASAKNLKSMDEIKEEGKRLKNVDQSTFDENKKMFMNRFNGIADSLRANSGFMALNSACELLVEAVSKHNTRDGIANYIMREGKGWTNYSDSVVDDLINLVKDIQSMPVNYFESKPLRIVSLDEIKYAVIPDDSGKEIRDALDKKNIPVKEYQSGNEDSRVEVVNSIDSIKFSDREIVGGSGKNYGMGVYLDSNIFDGLTESDKKLRLKQFVTNNLAGNHFTAYDSRNNAIDIMIARKNDSFVNKSKKKVQLISELYKKNNDIHVKQESVVLADELIANAKYDSSKKPNYSHGWIDNYGNNDWEYWKVNIQEKDGSVWEATLNIANSVNGEKILYDIDPIKKVEGSVKSDSNSTDESIQYDSNTGQELFSDRGAEQADLFGRNQILEKENAALKEDVERLKERLKLEKQLTNGNMFDEKQLEKVAKHLKEISSSSMDTERVVEGIRDVYDYIIRSGSEIEWDTMMAKAYDVANDMIRSSKGRQAENDRFKAILSNLKGTKITLSAEQLTEAKNAFGKDWKQKFMNRVKFSEDGISLIDKWKEWSSVYPEIFKPDVNPKNMVTELESVLYGLKEGSDSWQTFNQIEDVRALATEIYNQYWNVSTIGTLADKYENKVKELNFKHRESMKQLRNDFKKRIADQKLADRMHYGKIINELRNKRYEEVKEAKDLGRKHMREYRDRMERTRRIKAISNRAITLNEWMIKNSKDAHVPEIMKGPVTALLNAIDFSSVESMNTGIAPKKFEDLATALRQVYKMASDIGDSYIDEDSMQSVVDMYVDLPHGFAQQVFKLSEAVNEKLEQMENKSFILEEMNLEELKELDDIVKTIKTSVTKMNQFFTVAHSAGVANLSQKTMEEMKELGSNNGSNGITSFLQWTNANPVYAFKRFGEGGKKVFRALQDGQDKLAFHTKEIKDFAEALYTSDEINEWRNDVREFDIMVPVGVSMLSSPDFNPEYVHIQMTIPQIMSLYCLSKREQAKGHLFGGGIRISDFGEGKKKVSQTEGVILSETELDKIISSLDERQIEVADALQKYMNTVCSDWGNEVSMQRFGYKAFGEENYFPIQSDKNNLAVDDAVEKQNSLFRLLNMQFTKQLTMEANNRIVINDIFDVFSGHASDMAKYNAFALPILDTFKWYNYKEKERIGEEETQFITRSLKETIENAYGNDAKKYITDFLRDLNGQFSGGRDHLGNGILAKAKTASVAGNLRVALLQPTAYIRAANVISADSMTKAFSRKPRIDLAEKYCGMAVWKSMGFYDMNVNKGVTDLITHNQSKKDKLINLSMKGAEWGDKVTWGYLWNACEEEVKKIGKYNVGTEEFYKEVADNLRDVIYLTQVVDSVMTRSHIMRSKDGKDKLLTAFMSEPTLTYNMLLDSYFNYKMDERRGIKNGLSKSDAIKKAFAKNGKEIARCTITYVVQTIVCALVEAGFDRLRDTDEDPKEFMELFLKNFRDDISILQKLPGIKDIASIFQGYSPSRMDMSLPSAAYKAWKQAEKVLEGKGNPYKAASEMLKTLSYATGLPFYNVLRDMNALFDKAAGVSIEEMFNDSVGTQYPSTKIK